MSEEKIFHDLVYVTDKTGTRDRTDEIAKLAYDSRKNVYFITYKDGKTYPCRGEDCQIVKNVLKDKQSAQVFDYLLQMAQFSDLQNDEGQKLLVQKLQKFKFINENSVLARYLNPHNGQIEALNVSSLIFPFGCNNSQYLAVQRAMNNQISIIQGPPGTGKTQTILNIIANLLVNDKTVLIVSNNNAATSNVYEKLASKKYGLDFICAFHGRRENIEQFLKNQQKTYPEYISTWHNQIPVMSAWLDDDIKNLKQYFEATERLAIIRSELSALELETKHLQNINQDVYDNTKLLNKKASALLALLQEIQILYSEKERLGFFKKFKIKRRFGLGAKPFWKTDAEKLLNTLRLTYYPLKKQELEAEKIEKEEFIKTVDPEEVYSKCLSSLQFHVASKYIKNLARAQFKDGKDIYIHPTQFANEYPVILSTTFSSRATIGPGAEFLFDYVIMDEASQVDVVTGALALSCAKNAVIVGDKMQLPNVIEEKDRIKAEEIFSHTSLDKGYNYTNSFLSSLEQILPYTPQTVLREHYRCHPKIINFCNQQFYGGKLLIMTKDNNEEDVLTAIRTTPGDFCKQRYNQRQIDVIKEDILSKYSQEQIQNLGIIAPYNNQTDAIKAQIPNIDAATVHKYQGREKDNIIISTVDNVITPFTDDSNMLNVAISRAKKKLAVVISGNEQPEHSNITALLKYIQYNNCNIEESKVSSIFDFFYTKNSQARFEYLATTHRISKYDSENAMNALLAKIMSDPRYSRFSFVFELPLKEVVDKNYMHTLPPELSDFANKSWAHVDFTVFNRVTKEILFGIEVDGYTYHKHGTRQSQRDQLKNQIFDLLNLPLLRLSTRGSNEESQITELLDRFLGD